LPNIVLASISPRRRELLGFLGLQFQVIPSAIEEFVDPNLSPEELVIELATRKAQAVQAKLLDEKIPLSNDKTIIIAADTIVFCGGNVLNKPSSKKEAVEMLSYLSAKTHQVYTGVTVLAFEEAHSSTIMNSFSDVSKVRFRELSPFEIEAYVETGEPMDKAGSYALQGVGCALIESIEGCYTNIIGLPMPKLVLLLRSMGVEALGKQTEAKIC
jgi:septum formation protein